MELKKIKVNTIKELVSIIQDFKELYNLNQEELIKIAKDENQSFVKRKFIKLLSSDDDKISFEAIKYLQSLSSIQEIEIDKIVINYKSDGFILNEDQNNIYKRLYKENNGKLMTSGDIELLKLLSINIDHYNKLKIINEATGFKMKFKTGAEQVRPEFTVMKECVNNIKDLIDKLGLSTISGLKKGNYIDIDDPISAL
jgi:hypothetical protein